MERSTPKGPGGEKRPADIIGAAIRVARVIFGEEEDEWTLPGAQSPEEALSYFSKQPAISARPELCDGGDPDAEFRLNKENPATSWAPASTTTRYTGVAVEQFLVKRA